MLESLEKTRRRVLLKLRWLNFAEGLASWPLGLIFACGGACFPLFNSESVSRINPDCVNRLFKKDIPWGCGMKKKGNNVSPSTELPSNAFQGASANEPTIASRNLNSYEKVVKLIKVKWLYLFKVLFSI